MRNPNYIVAANDHATFLAIVDILLARRARFRYAKKLPQLCALLEDVTRQILIVDLLPWGVDLAMALAGHVRRTAGASCICLVTEGQMAEIRAAEWGGLLHLVVRDRLQEGLPAVLRRCAEAQRLHFRMEELLRLEKQSLYNTLLKEAEGMKPEDRSIFEKNITRRSFLKGTAAVAAATGVSMSGGMKLLSPAEAAPGEAMENETIVKNICRVNCSTQTCLMNVHVRNGHVVKTSMAPAEDTRYNRICLRGLSHVQRINHPNRVKYPMKRMGERGEGKWEQISWDEAITTIVNKFSSVQKEYGNQAVAFAQFFGNFGAINGCAGGIGTRFFNCIGATMLDASIDMALGTGITRVLGGSYISEPAEFSKAKTFFAWGSNVAESRIQDWHFLADAIENGTKLVTIDPKFTQTAAKSHIHAPIRPGADVILAFSMMQVIIEEKIYDEKFLFEHTVAPFLVREDTKLFLRQGDISGAADGAADAYMVWSPATGQAGTIDTVSAPALEGAFTVNGIKVRTAFQLLKDMVAEYPPEVAVQFTDIQPEMTREIARLAADGPATFHLGYGPNTYDNGDLYGQYVATLAALTGNLGVSGASCGGCFYVGGPVNFVGMMMPDFKMGPTVPFLMLGDVLKTGQYGGNPHPIKAMYQAFGNIMSNGVNQRRYIDEILPALDFVVVAEMTMTDSANYADMVLPVAHYFEVTDFAHAVGNVHMQWGDKAVEPAFEAKSDYEIFKLLAPGLGVEKYINLSEEEYHRLILDTNELRAIGITYETLKEKKSMRYIPAPYIPYADKKFATPSGRCEIYVEKTAPRVDYGQDINHDRQRLTGFYPPAEAWPDNPLFQKYPLVCVNSHSKWRAHSQWHDEPFMLELNPVPTIEINADDAQSRNIKTGDTVEAYNDHGHVVLKAVVTNGIKPGVVDIPKGWQRTQFISGGYSELTGTHINPLVMNQSYFDTLVEVRKV